MSPVSLLQDGEVAVITIDNPPVNALSQPVRAGLVRCIADAEQDGQVRSIVLMCAGRTFIAGADIREFDRPPMEPHLPDIVSRIEACMKPVVAALHGTAFGGGLEVAMGCHYRIAVETAQVGLPEVKLGLLPGASGTQRLPRLAGVQKALEIMLSGDPLPAPEALASGIVDRVVQTDLATAAIALALEVSGRPPRRVRDLPVAAVDPSVFEQARSNVAERARGLFSPAKIIRCVEMATDLSFDAGCEAERQLFLECKASPQSAGLRHAFFAERETGKVPGIDGDTPLRPVNSVAVIGAGTMGAGIAYACLSARLPVRIMDNSREGLEQGVATIRELFDAGVKRGKLSDADRTAGLARLSTGNDYESLADTDLVIEAAFENIAVKKEIFSALDRVCKPGSILATNTSTLDIDAIASATNRAADVIGLHFFSPAHVMRLLEIVRGRATATDVIATSLQFAKRLRKIGVVVGNGFGFVGNRMLYSYGRENQLLLLEGAAPEVIDRVLYDWGMAMGPNAVGDLAGLDVGYRIRRERSNLPDDPRYYRVADLLAGMGRFGQKTGKGMYLYEKGSRSGVPDPEVQALIENESKKLGIVRRSIDAAEIIDRCIYGLVTEGARILQDGIALRPGDIDVIWINGYGFPRHRGGPMHYADAVGLDRVYARVCEFRDRFGAQYWQPPPLLEQLARDGGTFSQFVASG
ncbi:MAG: 3-hydroxyacyl-CoA dehydrogenase NAD-binding domain-containing protein [Woeseiaceae bacterium]|nr:3-hydroxyacyl-CoA dehydrogenase NAD-binding domain-containing protein [Woeseiaceae bacterium]